VAAVADRPPPDESAQTAGDALAALFRQQGAPLVLKCDNGPAFLAGELGELPAAWGVGHLFSPPGPRRTTARVRPVSGR
jgi:hypothetical protein